jgi:hypothetical protein
MNNGTLDFYSGVAQIIPVIVLVYVFSFRFINTLKQFYTEIFNPAGPLLIDHSGFTTLMIFIAPFVSIGMAAVGEIACLRALFTGHPTPADARWTIASLVAMGVGIAAQIAAIGLTQVYRSVRREDLQKAEKSKNETSAGSGPADGSNVPEQGKKETDNAAGKWRGRHAAPNREHSETDSETISSDLHKLNS